MGTTRAWVIWLVGCIAYAGAVLQRSSFGVVGLDAAERFGTSAGIVSIFVVLQLLVYAGMQIPAGLLLDRFGTRVMVTAGSAAMFAGQLTMAFADTLAGGIIARVLVGAGDACIFGAVIRLIPAWFPPRRAPLLTQLTGQLGQLGQIASAVPFAAVNANYGWTAAFGSAAATAGLIALASAAFIRDSPQGRIPRSVGDAALSLRQQVASAWRHPGVRLGLWSHFTTSFPQVVFAMMWGFPFLQQGQGLPGPVVGLLMTVYVATGVVSGPAVGVFAQRRPKRRFHLALAIIGCNALPWALVLALPGPAPLWLLTLLAIGIGTSGPGAALSIDFPRSYAPASRLGTAIGVANMGGFTGGLAAVFTVGIVLDLSAGGSGYDLGDFRIALATQFAYFAFGIIGMSVTYRRLKRYLAAQRAT